MRHLKERQRDFETTENVISLMDCAYDDLADVDRCIIMEQACAITALAAKATTAALRAAELEVAIGELPINGAFRVQAIERALAHALKLLDREHNLLAHASGECDCARQLRNARQSQLVEVRA